MASSRSLMSVVGLLLAAGVSAQVPPGHFVLGTSLGPVPNPYPWTGPAGLFVGHPRQVGSMWAVTGLPPSLTTRPPTWSYEYGVGGLAIHPATGDLLVGDSPDGGASLNLYRIRITQQPTTPITFTSTHSTFALGVANPLGGIVVNPGVRDANRVIVGCANVLAGQIGAGSMRIGELDLSTGIVTPWAAISAMLPGPYSVRAICVEPGGAFAYMTGSPNTTNPSTVWCVPLPAAGVPTTMTAIATLPIAAMSMKWDASRAKLVVGGRLNTSSGQSLWEIDPVTVPTPVPTPVGPVGPTNLPSFDIEPTTGDVLFAGVPTTGIPGVHHYVRGAAAPPTWLGNSTAAGMVGLPFAFAVAPSPTPYGAASVCGSAPSVSWAAVSTAGLPLLGNTGYSLRLDAGPTGTVNAGLLAASALPLVPGVPIPGLCLVLNIDPTTLLGDLGFASSTIPLGIPNNPLLVGSDLFLQAATITNFPGVGNVLSASEGAWLRIL